MLKMLIHQTSALSTVCTQFFNKQNEFGGKIKNQCSLPQRSDQTKYAAKDVLICQQLLTPTQNQRKENDTSAVYKVSSTQFLVNTQATSNLYFTK